MNRRHLLTGAAATAAGALLPLPQVMAGAIEADCGWPIINAASWEGATIPIQNCCFFPISVKESSGKIFKLNPGDHAEFNQGSSRWIIKIREITLGRPDHE